MKSMELMKVVLAGSISATVLLSSSDLALAQNTETKEASAKRKVENSEKTRNTSARRRTPVLILVPVEFDNDGLGDGCWVRFYDSANFKGDRITLVGPIEMPSIKVPLGDFWGGFDSAIIGSKARVVTYEKENFRDHSSTLNAGERIPDLGNGKLGLFEGMESLKITCGF
jgi:hypothetical protein